MPGMTGVEFLSNTMSKFPWSDRIILTGYSDIGGADESDQWMRDISLPHQAWNETEMNMTINQALDTYNLRKEHPSSSKNWRMPTLPWRKK